MAGKRRRGSASAPLRRMNSQNYIDGTHFDKFGNRTAYDILRRHPGSGWYKAAPIPEHDTIPASHVIHWFKATRPGQHRGIPELTPSLSLFGTGRRFREATLAAAETAADFAVMLEMGLANNESDEVAPFTTLEIEKRMLTVMPAGSTAAQMRAEHPATTYQEFVRQMICESARPISMPYNIAACNSSDYTFSGGQLDHQTYFVKVGIERQSCVIEVLDRVFELWFEQAVRAYGWAVDDAPAPRHDWIWAKKPQNDPVKTALARKHTLAFGGTLLSDIFAEDGDDFEDKVEQMAADFGVGVDEMRAKLFEAVFPKSGGAPGMEQPAKPKPESGDREPNAPAAKASGNGNGRISQYIQGATL